MYNEIHGIFNIVFSQNARRSVTVRFVFRPTHLSSTILFRSQIP